MRVLNTCKMPININPYTVIKLADSICFLELKKRNLFSFITTDLFLTDLMARQVLGEKTEVLTVATENIFNVPCIVQIFSGYPAEFNQSEFFLGNNHDVETLTFEDLIFDAQEDMHCHDLLEDLLYTI